MLLRGLLDASCNLALLHGSERTQAMLSILGAESCGCLGSYNRGMIYLACQRICRRNTRDSRRADWEAFRQQLSQICHVKTCLSKTKEVLTLTSVKLERFLLKQKRLLSFSHINHLTHKSTRPQRHCNIMAT